MLLYLHAEYGPAPADVDSPAWRLAAGPCWGALQQLWGVRNAGIDLLSLEFLLVIGTSVIAVGRMTAKTPTAPALLQIGDKLSTEL